MINPVSIPTWEKYVRKGTWEIFFRSLFTTKVQREREKETKIDNVNYSNTSIYQQTNTTKFLSSIKFYPAVSIF